MLKFKFKSEEGARETKKYIQDSCDDYITLSEVISICGQPVESTWPYTSSDGWRWSDLRGLNIFVKQVRKTWYLYLCEPTLIITPLETSVCSEAVEEPPTMPISKENFEFANYLAALFEDIIPDFRLKAMVHHKEKGKIIERPCYFHEWTHNVVKKEDGSEIYQDLALCQFLDDGHIERISFDHIRFVEEWE